MYLYKYKNFHARVRLIIANPPPDTTVPKPSLISVSRCNIQQNNTAIIVKIDDSEIDVSMDSLSSNKRSSSSNIQSRILLAWSGNSDLESLKNEEDGIILIPTMPISYKYLSKNILIKKWRRKSFLYFLYLYFLWFFKRNKSSLPSWSKTFPYIRNINKKKLQIRNQR